MIIYKIYSKLNPQTLLHMIVRKNNVVSGRTDVVPENNFIQCAVMNLNKGQTFKPHKHIWKERTRNVIAQESWIVIKGSVQCSFFDLDDTLIDIPTLYAGDASFTLEGGHTYTILEEDTLVYEYKTGPYEGQQLDKVFINGV